MKACDCHLWLGLPPGTHHEHCRGPRLVADSIIVVLLAISAMTVTILGWMVFA